MKKVLKEELNRIHKLMGVKSLVLEATIPGLPGIIQTVKRVISTAANAGRTFAGDVAEIGSAINLLNRATNLTDEAAALAKLVKASPDFESTITPMIIQAIKGMTSGAAALDNIDDFIARMSTQGTQKSQIISGVDTLIDNAFSGFPEGLKDILKLNYNKKINQRPLPTPSVNPFSPYFPLRNVMSGQEIVESLRAHFAANPKAIKLLDNLESNLQSYIPKSVEEAESILKSNKELIQSTILGTKDEKKWIWLTTQIKNNWATKYVSGFFIGVFILTVGSYLGNILGINALSPLKQIMNLSFGEGSWENFVMWLCKKNPKLPGCKKTPKKSDETEVTPLSPDDVSGASNKYGGGN